MTTALNPAVSALNDLWRARQEWEIAQDGPSGDDEHAAAREMAECIDHVLELIMDAVTSTAPHPHRPDQLPPSDALYAPHSALPSPT